eukprot:gene8826-8917_t
MIPAVASGSFGFILGSFFVIALGFSLQQTAANPFVVALGPPESGSSRLNFAGSINNIGALLGPLVVGFVLFGSPKAKADASTVQISSIDNLYYALAGLFLAVALFFWFSNLPKVTSDEKIESSKKANTPLAVIFLAFLMILAADPISKATSIPSQYFVYASLFIILTSLISTIFAAKANKEGWGAMQYPQLILGMIAIFTYVGTEVTIQSNMGSLLKTPEFGSFNESQIAPYISLYWGSLMIGRFAGSIGAFNLSKMTKNILYVVIPFIAFGLVLLVNAISVDVSNLYVYAVCVGILVIAFFIGQQKPTRTVSVLGILGVLFMVVGKYTSQGSAFLIMMILGGSIIPPLQGKIADGSNNVIPGMSGIHFSYIVPVMGFAYLAYFAWKAQVGAVLAKDTRIISIGYNGPPAGTHNCDEEWPGTGCARDSKGSCSLALHAEENAILYAVKNGANLEGVKKVFFDRSYAAYKGLPSDEGVDFLNKFGVSAVKFEE